MRIEWYEEAIRYLNANGTKLFCTYCGVETICLGGTGFCSNCEQRLSYTGEQFGAANPEICASITSVAQMLRNMEYDKAASVYDGIAASNRDSGYLYAAAVARILHSNHKISLIRYDRQGFMEQNAEFRNDAAALAAEAKALLAQIIAREAQESSPRGMYTLFLAHLKLRQMRAANALLERLRLAGDQLASGYAAMLLESALGRYDKALEAAERLVSAESFSINAVFYAARAFYNLRNYAMAGWLTRLALPYMASRAPQYLLADIKALGATWM